MYKILCIAIACTFFKTTTAQIEKGKWIGGITLDGRRYNSDGYSNLSGVRTYSGYYKENQFNSSITINKMLSKNWTIGLGTSYSRSLLQQFRPPPYSPNFSFKNVSETIGFIAQCGYFKQVLKNIYLSQSLQIGYSVGSNTTTVNFNYPNETKTKQDRNQLSVNMTPIQLSYLYKKHFMLSINIATISYSNTIFSQGQPEESTIKQLTYNLNPFKNGFAFSYIF